MDTKLRSGVSVLALGVGMATAGLSPVVAQDTDDDVVMEEIVVTTTRRETNLMTTAAAVSAIGGEQLTEQGIFNATKFDGLAPNLRIADMQAQGMGAVQISMRGIVNSSFIEIGDPNVGFHVDGVYMSRPQAAVNLLFDAQRMEIARGPQGTLYGRNATVGAINVVNNRPDAADFSVSAGAEIGSYDGRIVNGVINIPLVEDVLAVRATGFLQKRDTYFDLREDDVLTLPGGLTPSDNPWTNTFGNLTSDEGAGAVDHNAYRLSMNFTPTDDLSAYVSYERYDNESPGAPQTVRTAPYTGYMSTPNYTDMSIETIRAEVKWEVADAVEIKGTFGDQNYFHEMLLDLDSGTSRYSPKITAGTGEAITFEQTFYDREWRTESRSYEVTATSTHNGPLQWMAGYFNFEEDTFRNFWIDLPTNGDGQINFNQPSRFASSEAFFGRLDYDISDQWHVSVGLRRTKDKRRDTGVNRFSAFPGNGDFGKYGIPTFLDAAGVSDLEFLCNNAPAGVGPCEGITPVPGIVGVSGNPAQVPGIRDGFAAAPGSPLAEIQEGIVANTAGGSTVFDQQITTEEQLRAISELLSNGEEVALTHNAAQFPRIFYTDNRFSYTDWSVTLDYTPREGTFLYATVATGHKSGSQEIFYQPRLGQFINSIIKPESLTSYEIGWKEEFDNVGNGLTLASTFFYMDYKNKQQSVFVDGGDLFCAETFGDFNGDGYLENFVQFLGGIPIFNASAGLVNSGGAVADGPIGIDGQPGWRLTDAGIQQAIDNCSQGSTGAGGPLSDNPGVPNFVELMQINLGNATMAGFEFEYDLRMTDVDRVKGYLTLNVQNKFSDANADALPFNLIDALACADRVGGCPDITSTNGNKLAYAPDVTFRADYEHDFVLDGGGTITAAVSGLYNSSYWLSVWNVDCYDSIRLGSEVCDNGDKEDGFVKLDARLRYTAPNESFTIEAYVDNLTKVTYATNAMRPSNEDFVTPYSFNAPRMYGVRASFSW